ncbi:MAG: hypothetical protein KDA80_21970 [Planctomycetaceae bacterium]|nr:hypothetical protein [Planctomycetaceae bacterium]
MRLTFSLTIAVACSLASPLSAQQPPQGQPQGQQQGPMTETISGTLKEVKEQGRSRTLVITDESGADQEHRLTPRIVFQIEAPADRSLIQPGKYIGGRAVLTNEMLFLSDVTVYFPAPGKRVPNGQVAKSQRQSGTSVNSYDVSGVVGEMGQSPDYPEYTMVALKIPGRIPPVMLEKNLTVKAVSYDPSMAKPGSSVELEVLPLKGGRVNLLKVTVKQDDPVTGEPASSDES